ncbi:MAG TPA: response regulator, partial [Candidatus Manganitrophaceae bacterium]|nr:response regulator [Candidatus Manganitrophaceae bacterium]
QSMKGKGATFIAYFPRTEQAPKWTLSPAPEKPAAAEDRTILVVDDEEAIRLLGKTILEHDGHRVLTAGDGLEAIEIFTGKKEEVDLVILDLTMPDRSGGEVLEQLRRIKPEVRVIISSGHRTEHPLDLAGVSFLQKPYRPADLLRMVNEVFLNSAEEPDAGD